MRTETRNTRILASPALAVLLLVGGSWWPGATAAGAETVVTVNVVKQIPFAPGVTLEGKADPAKVPGTDEGSVTVTAILKDSKGNAVRGQPVFFRAPTETISGRPFKIGTVQDAVTQTDRDGKASARLKFGALGRNTTLNVPVELLWEYYRPTQPQRRHSALMGFLDPSVPPDPLEIRRQTVSDKDLASAIRDALTAQGQANVLNAIFLFQTCFSGGMLDDLEREIGKTFPWVGGAAARHDEPSWYHGTSVDVINKRIAEIDREIARRPGPEALKALEQRKKAAVGLRDAAKTKDGLPDPIGGRPHGYWTSALVDELENTRRQTRPVPMLTLLIRSRLRDPVGVGPNGTGAETGNYFRSADGADIVFGDPDAKKVERIFAILWAGQADLMAHFHDIDQMEKAIRARAAGRPVDIQILFGNGETRADGGALPQAWRVKATRQKLDDAIKKVKNDIRKKDQFIFYASGHGTDPDDPPQLAPASSANRSVFAIAPRVMLGTILTAESTPTVTIEHRNVASPDLGVTVNGILLGHLDPSQDTTSFVVPGALLGTCAVVTIQSEVSGQDYEYEAAVTFSPGGMSPVFVDGGALPAPEACPDVISFLSPLSATNPEGTEHTVTARLVDDDGIPLPGREATFRILSGPNVGQAGAALTGTDGEASFTYTGRGVGVDQIRAFAEDRGVALLTNSALSEWTQPSTVTALTGSASRVGLAGAPGRDAGAQVGISVRFAFEGPINLAAATVSVHRLLHETGGAGELAQGTDGAALLPIVLAPKPGGTWTGAIYETLPGAIPKVRIDIRSRGQGVYDLSLRVDRATMPNSPRRCAADGRLATDLAINFVLEDGLNPSVAVSPVAPWRCLDLSGGDPTKPRSLRTP